MEQRLKNFADRIIGRNLPADVNFALAAIWKLSNGDTTLEIPKDSIIELENKYEKKEIGFITEDGAVWDDIFEQLRDEGLIDLNVHFVKINQLTLDLIHI